MADMVFGDMFTELKGGGFGFGLGVSVLCKPDKSNCRTLSLLNAISVENLLLETFILRPV